MGVERPKTILREVTAGVTASVAVLPTALASGLLAYAPFGLEFGARGAAAGIAGATVGGFAAALLARSSFMVSVPRTSAALVLAGLAATLLRDKAGDPAFGFFAMAVCVFVAGLSQVVLGLLGLGRLMKFVPHPVLAGFLNGVAILIALGALHVLIRGATSDLGVACSLLFAAVLAALIIFVENRKSRVPGTIAGLLAGAAVYYGLQLVASGLPLGPTVGFFHVDLASVVRFPATGATLRDLVAEAPHLLLTSLVIAVLTTLEGLLVARIARNLHAGAPEGRRFLVAQGLANSLAAAAGGIAISAGPSQTISAFSAGGRTRLTGMAAATLLLVLGLSAPRLLAGIPEAVLCAILFANAYRVLDSWSVALLGGALRGRARHRRGATWKNLAVVGAVTAVTATTSVTAGVFTGLIMSCLLFIVDMSRPLVRRRTRADEVFSRRMRPERDMEILRRSGPSRVVLDLQGVMFFGNTDDLCTEVDALFKQAGAVLLDLQRVVEIDVSAIGALEEAMAKARRRKKQLLFCNVPAAAAGFFDPEGGSGFFPDRDLALEWMEEHALQEAGRSNFEEIPFDQIEFLEGLDAGDIELVRGQLLQMSFPAGTLLCREGEEADYLWILSSGSVSILLGGKDGSPGRRIASLARGTIVGEMAFLAGGTRSATVRADEDVTGYMMDREIFDSLLRDHPQVGAKVLANIGREMARRVRVSYTSLGGMAAVYY